MHAHKRHAWNKSEKENSNGRLHANAKMRKLANAYHVGHVSQVHYRSWWSQEIFWEKQGHSQALCQMFAARQVKSHRQPHVNSTFDITSDRRNSYVVCMHACHADQRSQHPVSMRRPHKHACTEAQIQKYQTQTPNTAAAAAAKRKGNDAIGRNIDVDTRAARTGAFVSWISMHQHLHMIAERLHQHGQPPKWRQDRSVAINLLWMQKYGRNHNPKWHTLEKSTVWIFTASQTNRTQAWRSSDSIEKEDERGRKAICLEKQLTCRSSSCSMYSTRITISPTVSRCQTEESNQICTRLHACYKNPFLHVPNKIAAGNLHKVQNIQASWISHLTRHLLHFCSDTTQQLMLNLLAPLTVKILRHAITRTHQFFLHPWLQLTFMGHQNEFRNIQQKGVQPFVILLWYTTKRQKKHTNEIARTRAHTT